MAQGISLVRFPASAVLKRVLEEAINRRKLRQHEGYAYRLEEWLDPDKQPRASEDQGASRRPLDLDMTLAEYTRDNPRPHFVLIREHSAFVHTLSFLPIILLFRLYIRYWSYRQGILEYTMRCIHCHDIVACYFLAYCFGHASIS